jgi:ferredoxin
VGRCVGAGTCVTLAPAVFDQDDSDALVTLLKEDISDDELGAVEEAVDFCPAQAIWLERN